MEDGLGWLIGIGMVVGVIVLVFKLAITVLFLIMAIVIAAVPLELFYTLFIGLRTMLMDGTLKGTDGEKKILFAILLTIMLGVSLGGLLSSTWLRLSVSYIFTVTVIGISATTLSALLIYPYVKYISAVSAYRKREQHLIKP